MAVPLAWCSWCTDHMHMDCLLSLLCVQKKRPMCLFSLILIAYFIFSSSSLYYVCAYVCPLETIVWRVNVSCVLVQKGWMDSHAEEGVIKMLADDAAVNDAGGEKMAAVCISNLTSFHGPHNEFSLSWCPVSRGRTVARQCCMEVVVMLREPFEGFFSAVLSVLSCFYSTCCWSLSSWPSPLHHLCTGTLLWSNNKPGCHGVPWDYKHLGMLCLRLVSNVMGSKLN